MAKKYYDEHGNEVELAEARRNRGGCLKWIIGIIVLLIVFVACSAILGEDTGTETSTDQQQTEQVDESQVEETEEVAIAGEVTATEIIDTYDNNELQGEEQFEGQRFIITGTVDDVVASGDEAYIRMYSENDEFPLMSLEAHFSSENREHLTEINSGETVQVEGVVDGTTMFGDVRVVDAELVN